MSIVRRARADCFKRHVSTGKCLVCELADRIDELESMTKWIPIEERRPEMGKIVVCKCLEDYTQTGFLVREEYWEDEDTTSYIFKNVYENFIVVEAWMELPEDEKRDSS